LRALHKTLAPSECEAAVVALGKMAEAARQKAASPP
jgi:hypothetical protein